MRIGLSLRHRRECEGVRLYEDLLLCVPEFPDDCLGGTIMGGEETFVTCAANGPADTDLVGEEQANVNVSRKARTRATLERRLPLFFQEVQECFVELVLHLHMWDMADLGNLHQFCP